MYFHTIMACLKGGCLDFSHLAELKNIYITEIYMEKQYKSSVIKNYKITEKVFFFLWCSLKRLLSLSDFAPEIN